MYKLIYITTQVILPSWLVLAYDLLEDRCRIDIIITKFYLLCVKMEDIFANLDTILHDWTEDRVQDLVFWGIE